MPKKIVSQGKKLSHRKAKQQIKIFDSQLALLNIGDNMRLETRAASGVKDSDHITRVLARVYATILSWPMPQDDIESAEKARAKGN